jgi:hypothetical protein
MRGVPALVTAIFCCDLLPGDRPTCRERDGLVLLVWRRTVDRDGGDRLRAVAGQPRA